ncbi:MAG: hypothetical protein DRO39_02490 [Thermoprotei archaeon]|nr:MAG: hypothetical protein DRO39_02490 [Thermoprotei archaeon]
MRMARARVLHPVKGWVDAPAHLARELLRWSSVIAGELGRLWNQHALYVAACLRGYAWVCRWLEALDDDVIDEALARPGG